MFNDRPASAMLLVAILLVPATTLAVDDFRDTVAPILQRRCLSCHNSEQHLGGLSLHSAEAAFEDGYIRPGDSVASHLIDVVTPENSKAAMPKDADPLSAEEITAIRKWIDGGAKWPPGLTLQEPRVDDFDWWSYQPLIRPPVPQIDHRWTTSTIDKFICLLYTSDAADE